MDPKYRWELCQAQWRRAEMDRLGPGLELLPGQQGRSARCSRRGLRGELWEHEGKTRKASWRRHHPS